MKAWWESLQSRERWLVKLGIAVSLAFFGWLLVLRPLSVAQVRLSQSVATLEQQVATAQGQVAAILAARNAGLGSAPRASGRSLMALTDASAREAGLGTALKRIQPEGETEVKIEMEAADFDALVAWLERLDVSEGVVISEWSVDRALAPGVVNARMTLHNAR